jgi:hypothetical protein
VHQSEDRAFRRRDENTMKKYKLEVKLKPPAPKKWLDAGHVFDTKEAAEDFARRFATYWPKVAEWHVVEID